MEKRIAILENSVEHLGAAVSALDKKLDARFDLVMEKLNTNSLQITRIFSSAATTVVLTGVVIGVLRWLL